MRCDDVCSVCAYGTLRCYVAAPPPHVLTTRCSVWWGHWIETRLEWENPKPFCVISSMIAWMGCRTEVSSSSRGLLFEAFVNLFQELSRPLKWLTSPHAVLIFHRTLRTRSSYVHTFIRRPFFCFPHATSHCEAFDCIIKHLTLFGHTQIRSQVFFVFFYHHTRAVPGNTSKALLEVFQRTNTVSKRLDP